MSLPPTVRVSGHPLVAHQLAQLRATGTPPALFRTLVRGMTQLLLYEALETLPTRPAAVRTPLGDCQGHMIAERVGLVPILRAGLGMADAALELLPEAEVWHLGLYRDHQTLQPVTYYNKLPPAASADLLLVLDPMLATAGSAVCAVSLLKQYGARRIRYVGLIAAPEGVKALAAAHPDVPAHVAAVDSHLDERGYIVPGLGDAGDRQFATG
jgi:uracil phosphoribosyltransferase